MSKDSMPRVYTWVGADGRALEFAAKDSDGTAYDLTNLTVTITAELGATKKIDGGSCTVSDASNGLFSYTPSASEIDAAGDYVAQVRLENAAGKFDFLEQVIIEVQTPKTPT